ncbi:hypothetical protein Fot_51154 [Forsythia ovata]|uniref:Uncharacterized protein n=1 Tax=Forsythia ovata TaxID=205694 RepID=A0ABD1PUL5_9LAMI
METPTGTRTKLVPNRGSEGPSIEAQQQHTVCHFMPTPGVDMRGLREGPAATSIDFEGGNEKENTTTPDVRVEEIDISPMVEELERLNDQESATKDLPEPMREEIIPQAHPVLCLRDPDEDAIYDIL